MSDTTTWNTTIGQPGYGWDGTVNGGALIQQLQHIDQWAPLSHKLVLDPTRGASTGYGLAPTWVPQTEIRRLTAYRVLAAYRLNIARIFLRLTSVPDFEDANQHREYGDAGLLIDRVVAGVLGGTPTVTVDGANVTIPDQPDIPDSPVEPDATASNIDQRIYRVLLDRWETEANRVVDDWVAQLETTPTLQAVQTLLRQWAVDEQLVTKLDEQEHDTVGLGDGVLTLAWSAQLGRPVLRVYDPGFYFPVLTDDEDGYPTTVHIAWEFVDATGSQMVRRLTWSLEESGEAHRYPWQAPEQAPTTKRCYFTDGTWYVGDVNAGKVDALALSNATFATLDDGTPANHVDLGIDFIPVIHIPNTASSKEHYGMSILTLVAQVLDDLAEVDTDLIAAGKLAAGPAIALSGASSGQNVLEVRPGAVFELGAEGQMSILDLTKGLAELAQRRDDLAKRLSQNARIPEELLGRISSAKAISGVAMALAFGPFSQYIDAARTVREPRHLLLLKWVMRMFQLDGQLPAGPLPAARLTLGPYLPADRQALVDQVCALVGGNGAHPVISHQSAIDMLVSGGMSIQDAQHEVDRIRADDAISAKAAAEATGSDQVGADWLGVTLPEPPTPPTITLPTPPA